MVVVRTFVDVILMVVVKDVEEDVTVCPEAPHVQAQEGGGAVSTLSWTDLVNETGCHAKCSYKQYSFEKVSCQ